VLGHPLSVGVFSLTLIHKCHNIGRAFTRRPPCYVIKAYFSNLLTDQCYGYTRYSSCTPCLLMAFRVRLFPPPFPMVPFLTWTRIPHPQRVSRTRVPLSVRNPARLIYTNSDLCLKHHLSHTRPPWLVRRRYTSSSSPPYTTPPCSPPLMRLFFTPPPSLRIHSVCVLSMALLRATLHALLRPHAHPSLLLADASLPYSSSSRSCYLYSAIPLRLLCVCML